MYDKTPITIIEQMYLNTEIHKRELSKKLNLGMPSIDYALNKIIKLVKKRKIGNQIRYSLDYSMEELTPVLFTVENLRFERLPKKIKLSIRDFLKELPEKPVITLIFGSYANDTYTKNSDIDILLVFQKLENSKQIENIAKKISMKTNTLLSPIYLDYQSFKSSFQNTTKKFFKNIKKDKILISGIEWWRQLINEET